MNPKIPSDLVTYLVMSFMEDGPTYGYNILKRMNAASKDRWDVSYGTVYGALKRLEKNGLIERCTGPSSERNYFKLTPKGKNSLEKRRKQMKTLAFDAVDKIVGFLNIYRSVHGEDAFGVLLTEIEKEFR